MPKNWSRHVDSDWSQYHSSPSTYCLLKYLGVVNFQGYCLKYAHHYCSCVLACSHGYAQTNDSSDLTTALQPILAQFLAEHSGQEVEERFQYLTNFLHSSCFSALKLEGPSHSRAHYPSDVTPAHTDIWLICWLRIAVHKSNTMLVL